PPGQDPRFADADTAVVEEEGATGGGEPFGAVDVDVPAEGEQRIEQIDQLGIQTPFVDVVSASQAPLEQRERPAPDGRQLSEGLHRVTVGGAGDGVVTGSVAAQA